MSSSIESREVGSKEDFLEKGSVTTAKRWCEEARSVLGFRFSGEANTLRKTIKDTTSDLKKIDELMVFASAADELEEKLKNHQNKFKESAWELERLTKLYEQYESVKKAAGKRTKGKSRSQRKAEQKVAAAKMSEIKSQIELTVAQMQVERNELHADVKEAERKQAAQQELIKGLPDYKEISAARKKWNSSTKTANKLVASWQSKFDPETSGYIANGPKDATGSEGTTHSVGLNGLLKSHDWMAVRDAAAAERYRDEMASFVSSWQNRGKKYVAGRKVYNSAKKDAKHWMDLAESYLPASDTKGFREQYFDGISAANVNQFDVAGEKINPGVVDIIKKLVEPSIEKCKIWQGIRSKQYEVVKQQVEKLSIPQYREVALSALAEVVALAESDKEYEKAVLQFPAIETETQRIIDAAKHLSIKANLLLNKCGDVEKKVSTYTGDALTYASPLLPKIKSFADAIRQRCVDEPYNRNSVPTQVEIDTIYDELVTELGLIENEVDKWGDDAFVQQHTKDLAASKDYKPLLESVTLQVDLTRSAIFEYLAMGNDPTGDPAKAKEWNQKVDGAETYVSRRYRDLERGDEGAYDEIVKRLNDDKTALMQIISDIEVLTNTANEEIRVARAALVKVLGPLNKELTGSRIVNLLLSHNIRTPKWYGAAKAEIEVINAIVDTDNKSLLEEKTRVAESIHKKVVALAKDDAIGFLTAYPELQIEYDTLKDRLSSLKSRVNKKKVKEVLPQEQSQYGAKTGVIQSLKLELREAGPGAMAEEKAAWSKRVADLETEVQSKIFDLVDALTAAKKVCQQKLSVVKDRLFGELVLSVKAKSGKSVSPNNLPIMDEVQGCEGIMTVTKEVSGFNQLARRIDNLNTSITWLIEDGNKDNFASLLKLDSEAESEMMHGAEASMGFQARYRLALEHYNQSYSELKKKDGVDKGEKKRIVGLHDVAAKLAKKKNWKDAAQKMDLASRMMTLLKDDPMGSGVTGRGRKHLNELDTRWKKGVGTLLDSVNRLEEEILKSCKAALAEDNAKQIGKSFHDVVPVPFAKELPLRSFESEIVVLQAEPPKRGRDEKSKDREKKKQFREKALVKVRQIKSLITSGPMYKSIVFSGNPWSKRSGNVNGLELMRAINDLDLNIQRAID